MLTFVPLHEEPSYIFIRVLPAVLVEGEGFLCQGHGGKAVVLGDDHVSRLDEICQGEIGRVCPFVYHHDSAFPRADEVARIADYDGFQMKKGGRLFGFRDHWTAVAVD